MATRQSSMSSAFVHSENPATWLKPDEPLMAGGYDWSWCFIWFKEPPGFPGYRIGSDGSVWSCWSIGPRVYVTERWRKLRPQYNTRGYLHIKLCRDGKAYMHRLSRLVLTCFFGPCPEGWEACHWDGDKDNNTLANLRWGSKLDNAADTRRQGRLLIGESHRNAKATEADVREIRRLSKADTRSP